MKNSAILALQYNHWLMIDESHIVSVLKKMHFTDKETAVYIALLRLGSGPASVLAKQTDMPRPTARFICEQLVQKNLVVSTQKGNVIYYSVDSPEQLSHLLDQKERHIKEQKKDLKGIMETLKNMRDPQSEPPRIVFYEGLDAFRQLYLDILNILEPETELITFAKVLNNDINYSEAQEIVDGFVDACVKKKINSRDLLIDSPEARNYKMSEKELLSETRLVSLPDFDIPGGEFLIYKDKAWSLSVENQYYIGFRVHCPNIVQLYRGIFEIAWKHAQPVNIS